MNKENTHPEALKPSPDAELIEFASKISMQNIDVPKKEDRLYTKDDIAKAMYHIAGIAAGNAYLKSTTIHDTYREIETYLESIKTADKLYTEEDMNKRAIDFAEWIKENYLVARLEETAQIFWVSNHVADNRYYTTEGLFNLYLNSIK